MVVMTYRVNAPRHFPGTPEEVSANRLTHHFGYEARCYDCDCRPWGISVEWPCGTDIPRAIYENGKEVELV